eukprot:scaffold2280_cov430-Prasinococcus_capsulatus_cf.AAC.15
MQASGLQGEAVGNNALRATSYRKHSVQRGQKGRTPIINELRRSFAASGSARWSVPLDALRRNPRSSLARQGMIVTRPIRAYSSTIAATPSSKAKSYTKACSKPSKK